MTRHQRLQRDLLLPKLLLTSALLGCVLLCWNVAESVGCETSTMKRTNLRLTVENLRCEYLTAPLGMDVAKPRLSWILRSADRGQKQTAYQILVASTPDLLASDRGDLWDSGKVSSDQSIQVEYSGRPLTSQRRCHWKARVWDQEDRPSAWSMPSLWTMGLQKPADWQAQWIGAVADRKDRTAEERIGRQPATTANPPYAALLLRREVTLSKTPLRATAYFCGLGYCELCINGGQGG